MSTDTPDASESVNRGSCGCVVKFDGATSAYRRTLLAVIAINLAGFIAIVIGSLAQGSAALAANAMDFLADSATYAISLWAIGKSVQIRSGAAIFKSLSLVVMAVSVMGYAIWRTFSGQPPDGAVITGLGLFGFAANLVAALLLVRFREGDANVRSVWICTRNDLVHSLGVAGAGGLVWLTGSRGPDLLVGALLGGVFLQSAFSILLQARREMRELAA